MSETFPRELAPAERAALEFLLSPDEPGFAELRQQASVALVEGRCTCGCATVDLVVDRLQVPRDPLCRSSAIVHSWHKEPIENELGLIVFLERGWLSLLEISWLDSPPAVFPPVTDFETPEVYR